jgi:hypothetical protein
VDAKAVADPAPIFQYTGLRQRPARGRQDFLIEGQVDLFNHEGWRSAIDPPKGWLRLIIQAGKVMISFFT